MRRAGAAHICDDQCVPHRRNLSVKHSAGVCDGGLYELWTREHGYPPHSGQSGRSEPGRSDTGMTMQYIMVSLSPGVISDVHIHLKNVCIP